jgi:hypothetical protein
MSTLTLQISDEQMRSLRERAQIAGLTPEEIVARGIEEWIHQPQGESFEEALKYVLEKNRELYRRLA